MLLRLLGVMLLAVGLGGCGPGKEIQRVFGKYG